MKKAITQYPLGCECIGTRSPWDTDDSVLYNGSTVISLHYSSSQQMHIDRTMSAPQYIIIGTLVTLL